MKKIIEKINWERVLNVVGLAFMVAIGTLIFGFAFIFARAIIQSL